VFSALPLNYRQLMVPLSQRGSAYDPE
jgi:hypothetical protein